jgi:hypothetical protein
MKNITSSMHSYTKNATTVKILIGSGFHVEAILKKIATL